MERYVWNDFTLIVRRLFPPVNIYRKTLPSNGENHWDLLWVKDALKIYEMSFKIPVKEKEGYPHRYFLRILSTSKPIFFCWLKFPE